MERRHATLALLLIDLDRMDSLNAALGRDLGDRILREAAGRMARTLGASATLSRLGSDDFAAFFEAADLAAAAKHAAALLERCRAPYVIDCVAVTLTASIGIALHEPGGEGPAALFARAERALNQAKIRGRDRLYPEPYPGPTSSLRRKG
jgi:diguanylate cyclase (GGDEF)-like protein